MTAHPVGGSIDASKVTGTLGINHGGTGSTATSQTSTIATVLTAGSGVKVTSLSCRRWGPLMVLEVNMTITAAKSGGWTAFTLNEGYRPTNQCTAAVWGHNCVSRIANSGVCSVDGTRAANSTMSIGAAYFYKIS